MSQYNVYEDWQEIKNVQFPCRIVVFEQAQASAYENAPTTYLFRILTFFSPPPFHYPISFNDVDGSYAEMYITSAYDQQQAIDEVMAYARSL